MTKKITLGTLLILFTAFGVKAQSVANTYWSGALQGAPAYIHFTGTDVEIAFSDITYGQVATYTEAGSNITFTDIGNSTCFDPGEYSKTYSGNTLTFAVVNEPCTSTGRDAFFTSGPWTSTSISVYEAAKFEYSKLFPNPSSTLINLELSKDFDGKEFIIVDTQGQTVSEGTLISGMNSISVSELNSGLYMIKLKDNARASIKFVKQ